MTLETAEAVVFETAAETLVFEIDERLAGARIDAALSAVAEDVSRSYAQKLIVSGQVFINGAPLLSKKEKVKRGDLVTLKLPEPKDIEAKPENIPLVIAYEDADVLVVDKPKGMVVHPAPGNERGTLVNAALYHCGDSLSSINGVVRPGIVHRLDKDTSGLIVIAKNDAAHRFLAAQFEQRTINRKYFAIVHDNLTADEGTIAAPLGRDPKNRLKRTVTTVNSKEAVTHFKVLERFGSFTLIEARLETGRTHQIRAHMACTKHPLLGDRLYGSGKNAFGVDSQMLHAGVLGFVSPRTGAMIECTSALPEEFIRVLQRLREKTGALYP